MKKFFAWMLMAAIVLSLGVVAFAADTGTVAPAKEEKPAVKAGTETTKVPSPGKQDVDPLHRPVRPDYPVYVDVDYVEPTAQQDDGWGPAVAAPKTTVAVMFSDNTTAVGDIKQAPYDSDTEAARSVAANAVKDVDTAIAALEETDPAAAEVLKAFFEKNGDNISQGVITIPEGTADGTSVQIAVNAIGKGIVVFPVPADAANLGYVILP